MHGQRYTQPITLHKNLQINLKMGDGEIHIKQNWKYISREE